MFVATMSGVLGAMILIAIIVPWFLIALAAILAGYLYVATFYRASARELMVSFSPSSRAIFVDMMFCAATWYAVRGSHQGFLTFNRCSATIIALCTLLREFIRAGNDSCLW